MDPLHPKPGNDSETTSHMRGSLPCPRLHIQEFRCWWHMGVVNLTSKTFKWSFHLPSTAADQHEKTGICRLQDFGNGCRVPAGLTVRRKFAAGIGQPTPQQRVCRVPRGARARGPLQEVQNIFISFWFPLGISNGIDWGLQELDTKHPPLV